MHEMSLAENVVQILEEQSRLQSFRKVKQVWLHIGQLSSVDADALSFCLDIVSRNTLAAGAIFNILHEAGRGWCMICEKPIEVPAFGTGCPFCGRYQIQITEGEAIRLGKLQVE